MKVGIIGAGAWGSALATIASRGGADVVLWSYNGTHKHFDDANHNILLTDCAMDLGDVDVLLNPTPAAYFRETLQRVRDAYRGAPLIICAKGMETPSNLFMSEIVADVLPECADCGVLSGPQFAAELVAGVPTGSTLAGSARTIAAGRVALPEMYIQPTDDIIGAQVCGVGKNAVAMICGYNSVAAAGENERAMIFTRAWDEIASIGVALGANLETFMYLCGIGDLFLSATSATSRNFSGGADIARGNDITGTVEGIGALCGLISRAAAAGVDTPILCEMRKKMKL